MSSFAVAFLLRPAVFSHSVNNNIPKGQQHKEDKSFLTLKQLGA